MLEIDQLIADITNEVKSSSTCISDSCQKTLDDYNNIDDRKPGEGGGPGKPLRMIAWDQA